jgi:multiple sugar transport system permease protein
MAGGVAQDPIGAEPRPSWLSRLTRAGEAGDAVSRRPPLIVFAASAFVLFWLIVAAFPFAWTVWGSFKIQADFFSRDSWWNAILGTNTTRVTGDPFTGAGYYGAWVTTQFWRAALNTLIITVCVTTISLTLGTLGGYALARSTYRYRFYILVAALFFRAMPEVTLVSGYLYPFFALNIWGYLPTAIIVLVALNQPFTLWMMYSFFQGIPRDLDESALVDGCTRFQAFRLAIVPVMWPGVITTGLFSFLLAYNDFSVTGLVLSERNQTMIPKINSYLGQIQADGNVMFAVAAVVSVTIPIFLLVMFFQRYLVSGLTAGAVKG